MSGPAKVFNGTHSGAPNVLNNVNGTLIQVLDACLITGYGSITLDTLVVSGGVATATKSTGHGFTYLNAASSIGPVVVLAGASPAALNGEVRTTYVSATQFTFPTTAPNGTATGTITAKRAPANWQKEFTGTNKAVYRSQNVTSNRMRLQVLDAYGSQARVRGWSYLTDVDAAGGLDPFPSLAQAANGTLWHKSDTSTVREWRILADDQNILFSVNYGGYTGYLVNHYFGDLSNLRKSNDPYATVLWASTGVLSAGTSGIELLSNSMNWICRGISQTGTAVAGYKYSRCIASADMAETSEEYPPPGDGLMLWPVYQYDSQYAYRGVVPGLYGAHSYPGDWAEITDLSPPLNGRIMMVVPGNTAPGGIIVDKVGPWF